MALFSAPIIDPENPLYCPEVTAQQYISSIRLFQASLEDTSKFPYFHRMCSAIIDNPQDSPLPFPLQLTNEKALSIAGTPEVGKTISVKEQRGTVNAELTSAKQRSVRASSDSSDALLKRPSKRVKRSSSHVDLSFVISAKAERLRFSEKMAQMPSSDIDTGQDCTYFHAEELFWPDGKQAGATYTGLVESVYESGLALAKGVEEDTHGLGPETPRSISALFKHLEKLLPGLRLRDRLDESTVTHQDVVNVLGIKGLLNPRTLHLFRHAQVQTLNLTESMADVDGLNLLSNETLKVLKAHASFQSLRSIVLSDVPLLDDDLTCLNNLPSIESLFLDDTQIGDVAVMHLIALRESLAHVELSWNDRITDDAIPTLCNFTNLTFLSLTRTAITMKGLRRLACSIKERERKITVMLPSDCEEYLCNLHKEYEVKITDPLIHDPEACCTLSESALKENLAAHAARNPEISTDGIKTVLEKRLRKLLERRKKDLIVQGFMPHGFA